MLRARIWSRKKKSNKTVNTEKTNEDDERNFWILLYQESDSGVERVLSADLASEEEETRSSSLNRRSKNHAVIVGPQHMEPELVAEKPVK